MNTIITLRVNENMWLSPSRFDVGNEGDHNATTFALERPSSFEQYICRAIFVAGDGKEYDPLVYDNRIPLTSNLTSAGILKLRLRFTNVSGEVIGHTNIVDFTVGKGIDGTDEYVPGFQDSIAQLADSSLADIAYDGEALTSYNMARRQINHIPLIFTNDHSKTINRDLPNQHPASAIAFEDGDSFQYKYNSGQLTGPPGPSGKDGDEGPPGPQGIQGEPGQDGENFDPDDLNRINGELSALQSGVSNAQETATTARNIADLAAIKAATAGERAEVGIGDAANAQNDINVHTSDANLENIHVTAVKQTVWNAKKDNLYGLFTDSRTQTTGYWHKLFQIKNAKYNYTDTNVLLSVHNTYSRTGTDRGSGILSISIRQDSSGTVAIGRSKVEWISMSTVLELDYFAVNAIPDSTGNTIEFYIFNKVTSGGYYASVISMASRYANPTSASAQLLTFTGYVNHDATTELTTLPTNGTIIYSTLGHYLQQTVTNASNIIDVAAVAGVNSQNISALQSEATAKWETLNRTEARSLSNEMAIASLLARIEALEAQ